MASLTQMIPTFTYFTTASAPQELVRNTMTTSTIIPGLVNLNLLPTTQHLALPGVPTCMLFNRGDSRVFPSLGNWFLSFLFT